MTVVGYQYCCKSSSMCLSFLIISAVDCSNFSTAADPNLYSEFVVNPVSIHILVSMPFTSSTTTDVLPVKGLFSVVSIFMSLPFLVLEVLIPVF